MQFLPMADRSAAEKNISDYAVGEVIVLSELEGKSEVGEVCCGGSPPPRSSPFEQPGYVLQHYISAFIRSEKKDIPVVETSLQPKDIRGTLFTRIGIGRDDYKVAPGLYGVGRPDCDSPVIVTANYKLTFDAVRKELGGIDCWMLVLDTCGINVWCAAGKGTFSTEEIVRQVERSDLAAIVKHRRLVVPQLGATGVSAHQVKLKCGFRVIYGPVRSDDLPAFLQNDMKASEEMRAVTFTLWERFELIPVEFYLFGKKIWWIFPFLFFFSGIGPSFFSVEQAVHRGVLISLCVLFGGLLGAMIVPLLLPFIPGRSFSLKGTIVGVIGAGFFLLFLNEPRTPDMIALVAVICAICSYLSMNFTGSTPYTSPSGVEKEMKIAIPLQAVSVLTGALFWLVSPFV